MFEIVIPADSFVHFSVPIEEYVRRMRGRLVIVSLPAGGSTDSVSIIRRETRSILAHCQKHRAYTILCDIGGKTHSTQDLARHLQKVLISTPRVRFVIGGSYGFDAGILAEVSNDTLSLGALTLPHALAVLTVAEQIYRVDAIWRGSGYHHG